MHRDPIIALKQKKSDFHDMSPLTGKALDWETAVWSGLIRAYVSPH